MTAATMTSASGRGRPGIGRPPRHAGGAAGVLTGMLLLACSPSAAMADWAYTHWGMTPEQVAAASSGAAKVLPPAQRTRYEEDHWELAVEGTFNDGPLRLSVGFTFDTRGGGLKCVMYNVLGADVEVLRAALLKRYGKPGHESSFAGSTTQVWTTPDHIDLVVGENPTAAVVNHCAPGQS